MRPLVLSLLFAALAALKVDAQDAIHASLQPLGIGVSSNDLYLKEGERYVRLPVQLNAMPNKAVTYQGPLVMPIFRKSGAAYTPVASVQFPPSNPNVADEFILLFFPAGVPALVRNDASTFPQNAVRVINTLSTPTGVLVKKDTPAVMQPGEIKIFPCTATDTCVEVHVAIPRDGNWTEVANNVFTLSANYRRTIFVIDCTPSGAQRPLIDLISMAQSNTPMKTMKVASDY